MDASALVVIALVLAWSGAQLTVFLPQMRLVWRRVAEQPDAKLRPVGVALLVAALAVALFAAVR